MGFSDYYVQTVSTPTPKAKGVIETSSSTSNPKDYGLEDASEKESALIPDQEILDSTEEIYFRDDVDTGVYELNVSSTLYGLVFM